MHTLLLSLGSKAYMVQGGDVGSTMARLMAINYAECKACHLDADLSGRPEDIPDSEITAREREAVQRFFQ